MITVKNDYFIAEGKPGNLGGRGRDEAGGNAYTAEWSIWGIAGVDETPSGDEIIKDDLVADGFVKWDECSNWSFKTNHCMHHACTREALAALGDILAKCWDASADLMPQTWSGPRVIHKNQNPPIIISE